MLKNRAKRLFGAGKQQQQQARNLPDENALELVEEQQQQQQQEPQQFAKQDYFDFKTCHRIYSCVHCRAHLADHDQLISKLFQGNHGRAYLFNRVVNIGCRQAVQRELLTGLHAVADIYCDNCETTLGWKYEQAFVPSQKYKEGKYIIELVHMLKENNWDLTSYNARELIREANLLARHQQQQQQQLRRQSNTHDNQCHQHCNFQQQPQLLIRSLARRTAANGRLPVGTDERAGATVNSGVVEMHMVLDVAQETLLADQQQSPQSDNQTQPADGSTVDNKSRLAAPSMEVATAAETRAEATRFIPRLQEATNAAYNSNKASETPSVNLSAPATEDKGVAQVIELTINGSRSASDNKSINIMDGQSDSASGQSLCSLPDASISAESIAGLPAPSSATTADSRDGARETAHPTPPAAAAAATNPSCGRHPSSID